LQQAREQEIQASEKAILQLQEEERRLVRSLEYQALQDEEFARKIVAEEREQNSQENQRLSQPITAGTPHTKKVTKGKKIKSQDTQASRGYSTLDRWFLPTSKQSSFLDSEGSVKTRHKPNTLIHCTNTDLRSQDFVSSSSTSSDICNLTISQLIEKRTDQEEKDFQLALKLQKEFDLARKRSAEIDRKKGTVDGYLLRTSFQSEKEDSCSDTHS